MNQERVRRVDSIEAIRDAFANNVASSVMHEARSVRALDARDGAYSQEAITPETVMEEVVSESSGGTRKPS